MSREPIGKRLEYGLCECEYPCSCVRVDGVWYGSIVDVLNNVERLMFHHRDVAHAIATEALKMTKKIGDWDERYRETLEAYLRETKDSVDNS